VEHDALLVRHSAISSTGKSVPGFVVGPHRRDDGDAVVEQRLVLVQVDAALLVDAQAMDDVAFLLQVVAQRQDRRMLDVGGDHRVAFRLRLERREDGGRVGLGAAGGEDDFRVVLGAEQRLHLAARLPSAPCRPAAEAVDRRGIAELLGEEGQHGLDHGGSQAVVALLSR
jgi:hypothetical protein